MFLLTRETIAHNITKNQIQITDVDATGFGATFYYFRLGSSVRIWAGDGHEERAIELSKQPDFSYPLPPRAFATVFSYETFHCSERIFALFGQSTSLGIDQGLQLIHGPTIDPRFNNPLKMGLKNLLDEPVIIRWKQQLGKVLFFDVSDTYPLGDHGQAIMQAFGSRGTL